MKQINDDYFLQFDFNIGHQSSPIQFSQPEEIITTNHIDEVEYCFEKVNNALKRGKYVAGYVSYEASYAFYPLKTNMRNSDLPLLWFGVFHSPTQFDKQNNSAFHVGEWTMSHSKNHYKSIFDKIMKELKKNSFEQINYTVPFTASFKGDTFSYYKQLKNAQQSHYNAFLKIGDYHILSISPELFFHLDSGQLTVKPMKGTIHRGKTYEEDLALKQWLQSSAKNQLENDLSVQLMKEELKKVAVAESLSITKKYEIEPYPTLYQMTSTITGEVLSHLKITDIIKQLFPSVSITGSPKAEVIDYIAQVEGIPRNVYCGTIGYIAPNNEAIFNVPIRTVTINRKKETATYNAGGAITLSSNANEEFEEVITKTKVLHTDFQPFQLLESIGLHDGQLTNLQLHLNRLSNTATYFNFKVSIKAIHQDLIDLAQKTTQGKWKVRLLVNINGQYFIESILLKDNHTNKFKLASLPIDKENQFLYHKTTHRKIYNSHKLDDPDIFDTLLWNHDEEITEFTIGNIVVNFGGELITPPIECGLLPGTFREKLLKDDVIKERIITKDILNKSSEVWLINSVRHWVKMEYKQ